MKDQRKTEIKVGITVLASLLIFIYIIGWAKGFSFTARNKSITVRFENVAGLEKGDVVTINGVRKGVVNDITLKENYVLIDISVQSDVKLKSDAKFSISMLDLMGGKKIEIKPGSSSEDIDYNKIQNGTFTGDIPAVMSMVGTINDEIPKLISQTNVTLEALNRYLTDRKLEDNIKTSIENLAEVSKKLNIIIDENRANLNQLTSNSVELTKDAKDFLAKNKEDLNQTVKDISVLIKKSDQFITKINDLVDQTTGGKNNLGKVLYDETLLNDLKTTLQNTKDLTKILLEQLKGKGIKADVKIF